MAPEREHPREGAGFWLRNLPSVNDCLLSSFREGSFTEKEMAHLFTGEPGCDPKGDVTSPGERPTQKNSWWL